MTAMLAAHVTLLAAGLFELDVDATELLFEAYTLRQVDPLGADFAQAQGVARKRAVHHGEAMLACLAGTTLPVHDGSEPLQACVQDDSLPL
jgi:hypothetical protein